jgi:hypothetical protein
MSHTVTIFIDDRKIQVTNNTRLYGKDGKAVIIREYDKWFFCYSRFDGKRTSEGIYPINLPSDCNGSFALINDYDKSKRIVLAIGKFRTKCLMS